MTAHFLVILAFFITLICLIIGSIWYLVRDRVYRGIFPRTVKANRSFRRRDTAAFIGKKLIHRITALKNSVSSLRLKRDSKFKLRRSFAKSFSYTSEYDTHFPKEYKLIIKALNQIFNFDNNEILKILEKINIFTIEKQDVLFSSGNIDKIYIVKSGSVELFYSDEMHKNLPLRVVGAGEPICTSTFFLEQIISKNPNNKLYKLSATALETSIICSFNIDIFKSIFCSDVDALIRLIQLSVLRLQHVIFRTLCQSFGIRLDLLINECNYSLLPEPEIINFETAEMHQECVIQVISVNRYERPKSIIHVSRSTDNSFREACILQLLQLLRLDSSSTTYNNIYKLINDDGICLDFKNGEMIDDDLINEGSLYLLFKGSLVSKLKIDSSNSNNVHQITLKTGQIFGLFSVLSGTKTKFSFLFLEESQIFVIPQNLFRKLSAQNPYILQLLAINFLGIISPFMKNLNFGLEWESYETGSQVYCEGSIAENIYIIQHGRLQLISENKDGEKIVLGEFSKNDFVGMDESFERKRRIATLTAVRATEVVSVRTSIFDFIQRFCPEVMLKIANMLSRKIGSLNYKIYRPGPQISPYSTVALVPSSPNIPIKNFAMELNSALNLISPSTVVDNSSFTSHMHPVISKFRYLEMINQLESDNYIILWICDYEFTEWTQQSILHADLILIVASIEEDSNPNILENQINKMTTLRTPQHLVLLHREDRFTQPENTAAWLSCRSWISDYYHIRCSNKIYRNNEIYMEYFYSPSYLPPQRSSDFSRLARKITHTSVGLVLGGGGAKGFSHVGVICALEKAGIPIDMIGGCSIGAFIGALYATSADSTYVMRRSQNFAEFGMSIIHNIFDLTLPIISFFTGSRFNYAVHSIFENTKIEDFLIPYFCVSTDISAFELKVHSCGMIWRACRASMSLLNFVPPICDPKNNHLLIDGGYLNVLPFDVMFRKGAQYIIAVDVSRKSAECIGDYGDDLSGWRVLWNKICPFGKKLSIPSMNDIHDNLCFINCMKLLSDVQNTPNVLYLSPPIQQFHVFSFQHHKEITNIGLEYTEAKLKELGYSPTSNINTLFKTRNFDYRPSSTSYLESDESFLTMIQSKTNEFKVFEHLRTFSGSLELENPAVIEEGTESDSQ